MVREQTLLAYIDESKRSDRNTGYMISAVIVPSDAAATARKDISALKPKGSTRIHMCRVRARDQLPIVTGIAKLDIHSRLFVVTKKCDNDREARDVALSRALRYLDGQRVRRVTIESCHQDHADKQVIRGALGNGTRLEYLHEEAGAANPLLWLPDVHAWAWGRGGKYRAAIEQRITVEHVP